MKPLSGWLALAACAALLLACGGGGGNPGAVPGNGNPGTGTTAAATVAVSFVNASGQAANAVTSAAPLTARALVKDAAGKAVANALVTFATDAELGVFSPSAGTALSDASGVASVTLRPASLAASGAGTVTASATLAGTTVKGDANFAVGATALTLSPLSLSLSQIAAYGSTDVTVDVLSGGVKFTEQLNVAFSSACVTAGKASLAALVPTSNGTARAVFRDLGCGNNDTISATVSGLSGAGSTASLKIASPAAASVQFTAAAPTDKSIVIKGQGGLLRTETATLTFKVFDIFSQPLANQAVTFSTNSPDVTLNKASDNTDAKGEVITTVNSGTKPTTFKVTATLAGGISTQSDSIVVTTGQAVIKAFSLSVSKANIEGWSYDSGTVTPASSINILLADASGNPVPDGAPVVFQTNLGAVGSSSKGGCTTVNGGCTVDFRSQNPRVADAPNSPSTPCNTASGGANDARVSSDSTRAGLATVCASTTDGSSTLFSKIAIFMSGSSASKVYLDGAPTPLTGAQVDLGSVGAYESKVFSLQINDLNFNPMPVDTTVAVANLVNATAAGVAPDKVPNIFPHSPAGDDQSGNVISGNQGSTHTVTIGGTQPKPCTGPLVGTFNVVITTPRGLATPYPFKLTFTCP
ncbi:Ig-like domain-containing protein [Janthinobacterium fluminis]|uniref:Ig-like domain-containing protein n=1 Tax=Janthinobacterium fluminis TaxID=2987524 RepID=A0ABT5K5I4_9BURK|nr:Ig-like domain-containing protein [Janthinobacterium fluminis]MDC8760262.1 Ig-like domain-containing protein [Janthinobacterium fluminis]